MSERTTVRLPKSLMNRAKRTAAAEGRTLTALIEEGLTIALEQRQPTATKRKLPRISKATGGMRPGLEGMTFSQLQELDDLEYVERMKSF